MKRRVLLSGAVALITVAAAAVATAAGAAVPPTPSGWNLVWSDDFTGANQHPSVVRQLDHRHRHQLSRRPGQLGHRRDPDLHEQHRQRPPGRRRQPADHPDPQRFRAVDLGPHRDHPHQLQGAGRRRAAHRGPDPDAQRDRRGRGRLLARVLGARRAVPRQLPELAGHRRVRHHGERQRHQLGLGRAALRSRAGRPVQRVQRHRRQPGLPGLVLPVRVPHVPLRVGRAASARSSCAGTWTASSTTPSRSPRSASRTGPT